MKRKIIIPALFLGCLSLMAQEKKPQKMVDDHVLTETQLKGKAGLAKSDMSTYVTEVSLKNFFRENPQKSYFTFPESRENSIRLLDGVPEVWMHRQREGLTQFSTSAQPGEYLVFQVGLYAAKKDLNGIHVTFLPWKGEVKTVLGALTCFNLEGVDIYGKPFKKVMNVEKGRVQPLWFGVQIPKNAKGVYQGNVIITPQNEKSTTISLKVNVEGSVVENNGVDQASRLSRMAWLNSQIGQDFQVSKGYVSVKRKGNSFKMLGRQVKLGKTGFPQAIYSYFDPNNQKLVSKKQPILADGFRFVIEKVDGSLVRLKPGSVKFSKEESSTLAWEVTHTSDEVNLQVKAYAEFDGFMDYRVEVVPLKEIQVKDIRLEIPMSQKMSGYMMGMGKEGGFRPESWNWKWNVAKNSQDAVWVGGVNGGLRLKLKGANYHRQLVNIYYEFDPLSLPLSWGNGEKGGADIFSTKEGALIKAYSGERTLKKGTNLHFDFEVLITPLKVINKDIQFNDRYYHSNSDVSRNYIPAAEKSGANIINIHHKKDINPYINYPYLEDNVPALSGFIKEAHDKDIRVKVYYTTRELTINTPEIWAMRSLNGEVIFPGPGKEVRTVIHRNGPHPWLVENFKEDFIPAWKCTFRDGPYKGKQDLSVITTPDSRLNNFYLEGLNWMCKNMGIDGIYIDDSALDRVTLKRARKILDSNRPAARIDLHSWNHFNKLAGHACCLNLYMDVLPYIDLLWIGEGRNYDRSPDYWLIETVGVPFGLTSQMLQHGGNRWRGMVFGMTNRLGWYGPTPEYIWQFWDEKGIQDMEMFGFWDASCPVKTNNPNAVATVYKGKGKAIIAVANWTSEDLKCQLEVDWKKLGLNSKKVTMRIPAVKEYQEEQDVSLDNELILKGKQGFMIVVE